MSSLARLESLVQLTDSRPLPEHEGETRRTATVVQFRENEILYRAGEMPRGIYFLRSGCVKLNSPRHYRRGRTAFPDFITRLAGAGDLIGFEPFLRGQGSEQTAQVLKAGEAELFSPGELMGPSPATFGLTRRVLLQMLQQIEEGQGRDQRHYLASVQERIADQLRILAARFGVPGPDGILLDLRLTRNELAQLAGTINESLSRHLTEFKQEGILELRGKEILIKNQAALLAKAGHRD